jgi:serine/threonine protein kinase/TPR repeat protein
MKTCPVCDTDFPDQHTTCPTDGAVLIESHELAPGHLVRGKYRIVRTLGQGGMGVVYLADDTLLGVRVALKFLVGETGKDPRFIKRFRQEARASYRLRHPNVVEVTNLDQAEDGSLFIAMEFVDGPSLRAVIETAPAGMAVPRALNIFRGIASGLAAAHAQGTVHRDVKPENILLARAADGREQAKVLDFGIVAIAENVTRQSETRGLLLTPDYAAPEQWMEMPGSQMDGRTDLYALGCVLFEMLTGRTPFHGHNTAGWMKQHLEESPQPPSLLRPELASWSGLDSLTLRLLAKDRNYRPHDAELFQLLDAVHDAPPQQRPQTTMEDAGKRWETATEGYKPPAALPRPAAPPATRKMPKARPGTGRLPGWVWGALAGLALVAGFATWRLLQPQPPETSTPAAILQTAPPTVPVPASKPSDTQAPATEESQSAVAAEDKAPARKAAASAGVEQQAVTLYAQRLYTQAGPLLNQACSGGGWEACRDLGRMYHEGLGLARNDARAAMLFEKACDAGYAAGCDSLGISYQNGQGVGRDMARAASLYARACDAGVAKGCNNLGVLYATGNGVARDDARAAALYAKACDEGEAMSCSNLGNIYASGRGVERNDARAVQLYAKACEDGDGAGCSNLGNRYRLGLGVDKDPGKARQLLGKGCALGNLWGCDRLKAMH